MNTVKTLTGFLSRKRLNEGGIGRSDVLYSLRDVVWRLMKAKEYATNLKDKDINKLNVELKLPTSNFQQIQKVIAIARGLDLRTLQSCEKIVEELIKGQFNHADWWKP